ncbi:hypothetical protein [Klebsiella spallanzanii]|uniref:Hydroxymethyl transferase n=1 Tax=Klebsiella spallanzanii TaxID=2587528 RepID=A0A564JZ83_9ENTR|nr:hypothetical protein [Klebsiella spallanzanii]VUS61878.1 hypothetical protein SB6408_00614 [Klebsiella spallanzanii]
MQLDFTLNISNDTWYPTADISGFKSTTGASVDIQEKMVLTFSAPGKITAGDVNVSTNPWCELKTNIESSEVSSGVFDIKLTITAADGSALGNAISNIHMGVNASSDTVPKWETFRSTFTAAADEEADVAGELAITCAAFPIGLENTVLELVLVRGEKSETLHPKAGITNFDIDAGVYAVSAAELRTAEGTIRAAVQLSAAELTITKGQRTSLDISFAQAERSTTLDVAVNLPATHALYHQDLNVVYLENGVAKQRYTMRAGQKQRLERLPIAGTYSVCIDDIKLNNIHYTFVAANGALDNQLHEIAFANANQSDESASASANLTINIDAEKTVASTFSMRLVDGSDIPRQYLLADLAMKTGSFASSVKLIPGIYQVESTTVIHNGVVYYIDVAPQTLNVEKNAALTLVVTITEGANLCVKGFPEFLSFGGCANMSPSNVDDLAEARVSSLFKYSGDDGMGDASAYLDPAKEPTTKIIQMARDVAAKTGDSVLPMMVSYTCNLSLGDVENIIDDPERHQFSFANFIQALQMAQAMKDDEHPVPGGFIVNPDYLGECQKYGFSPDYVIPVRKPLAEALAHHGVNIAVPAAITDTLKGYIKGVNWLVRAIAPDVVLGWQVNLWSVGGSQWVYNDFTYDDVFDAVDGTKKKMTIDPTLAGKLTAEYALLVGVFEDIEYTDANGTAIVAKGADFMAADRYEADDFTARAYKNGYCYSPFEWDRTFEFCAALSRYLRQPVLPWQVPASRLATVSEQVGALEEKFWGTGGSYLMGHAEIGSSMDAINADLLDIEFLDVHASMMGKTPRELFQRHEWDFTEPKYVDFPSRGIFHVQVGGGATTGVVSAVNNNSSSWMRAKLAAYRNNPVKLKD